MNSMNIIQCQSWRSTTSTTNNSTWLQCGLLHLVFVYPLDLANDKIYKLIVANEGLLTFKT